MFRSWRTPYVLESLKPEHGPDEIHQPMRFGIRAASILGYPRGSRASARRNPADKGQYPKRNELTQSLFAASMIFLLRELVPGLWPPSS